MSYEEVMQSIRQGLSGDAKKDQAYLKEQMEVYKDHAYKEEIIKECGRMMYDLLDEEQRKQFETSMQRDTEHLTSALKEVKYFLSKDEIQKAKDIIEPIIKGMDQETMFSQDQKNAYYSFEEPFENILFEYLEKPTKTIQRTPIPYSELYYWYACVWMKMKEEKKAKAALQKSIQWNPMSAKSQLLYMDFCKEDLEKYFSFTIFAFQYMFHKGDLGQLYRNLAWYFDQKDLKRIAYGCYGISLQYQETEEAVQYMMAQNEQDWFNQPSMDEMMEFAKKYNFPIGPDEKVAGLAYGYGQQCLEEGIQDAAHYFLTIAYDLTGAKEAKELLEKLETM